MHDFVVGRVTSEQLVQNAEISQSSLGSQLDARTVVSKVIDETIFIKQWQ